MPTFTITKREARSLARRVPSTIGADIAAAAGREHKYHAETDRQALTMDRFKFDSLAELDRYAELKLLHSAGFILALIVHPKYPIKIGGCYICDVELDFEYIDENEDTIYEDVKGYDHALSRLKRKLVEAAWGIKVTVVK